jgi:hypothetical protein
MCRAGLSGAKGWMSARSLCVFLTALHLDGSVGAGYPVVCNLLPPLDFLTLVDPSHEKL